MNILVDNVSANRNKNIPVECLLNNFIDEDFQFAYKPLNFVDSLFLSSKFTIMNNFITPNSMKSHLTSVIGAIVTVTLHVCRFFFVRENLNSLMTSNVIPKIVCIIQTTLALTTVLIYTINVFQTANSTLIIIKIQQALRIINCDKDSIMKQLRLWNWISVVTIFSFYGSHAVVIVFGNLKLGQGLLYSLVNIPISFPDTIIDVSIIYVTRTVDLIGKILASWNAKMATNKQRQMFSQGETESRRNATKVFEAYVNLMESFRLCKNVFQFTTYIVSSKVFAVVWILKNFVELVNLVIACTQFYEQVRAAEETSMRVLHSTHNRDVRRLCKNVVRYNRATFRKLSSYGVFTVDAALPVRLLAAVLSYTVVLLQFAFLSG